MIRSSTSSSLRSFASESSERSNDSPLIGTWLSLFSLRMGVVQVRGSLRSVLKFKKNLNREEKITQLLPFTGTAVSDGLGRRILDRSLVREGGFICFYE